MLTDSDGLNLQKLDAFLKAHLTLFRNVGNYGVAGISTMEFDLQSDSLAIFKDCDLIMMWGVDYALSDSDIIRLFEYSRDIRIPVLISSMTPNSTLARVLLWLKTCKKIRSAFRRSEISQSLVGYYRSEKYFIELAKRSHLTCKKIFVIASTLQS